MKDETLTWNAGPAADVGLTNAEAAEIFNVSLEKRGSAFQKELGTRVKLLKAEFLALEVKEIIFAGTSGVKKPLPKAIQDDIDSGVIAGSEKKEAEKTNPGGYDDTGLNALGRLLVKVWVPEGPEDQEIPDTDLDEFEIWLEMEALQYCFVGMHIEAKVHSMSSGLIWIDSVTVSRRDCALLETFDMLTLMCRLFNAPSTFIWILQIRIRTMSSTEESTYLSS